ncbi:MAG: penicillin-binding protein 1A [Methylohalobius sp.]|nr:penicillin-binding protein 1A [Methylohalobius sp.]
MLRLFKGLAWLLVIAIGLGTGLAVAVYHYFSSRLPDPRSLQEVEYQTPLEIYSRDGKLLARFGEKKRIPVKISQIPKTLIHAFLAAEDARFYDHPGVDLQSLMRAAWELVRTGQKRQGGSTITMQVARNFFLGPEKTYVRKLKEILLALKMERMLSKEEILELYLNQIYFGQHAYGVAAASQIYYGKTLAELDLAQAAMLAGLPKAPSRFNPLFDPARAKERRNYVLKRMLELGFIDQSRYRQAASQPVAVSLDQPRQQAPYATEWVRALLFERYGESLYTQGYRIITTIDSRLQEAAESAVQTALHAYDERHGYRGVEGHIAGNASEVEKNQMLAQLKPIGATWPGLVTAIDNRTQRAQVRLASGQTVELDWDGIRWARPMLKNGLGPFPRTVAEVLKPGDLIRLRQIEGGHWRLAQIPKVQGALLSLDSWTGAILALVGGYDFSLSKFNRAVQAQRQPGSGFKPVLYTAALEAGFTPASLINDAPVVLRIGGNEWRPQNYSGKFYGPTRLREALCHSRNLASIRLLQEVSLDRLIETAQRFGFASAQLPRTPSLALGSGTASPLDMAKMYAVFANGGFRIEPFIIERIESNGRILFQTYPKRACDRCAETAPRVLSPAIHYLMHTMLQDVVQHGTAAKAKRLQRSDLAGKTGTTNEQRDAWFNGYAPPLVAIAWVGFDSSEPLGTNETGARAALPMWIEYMKTALQGQAEYSFPLPEGVVVAFIDPTSGLRTTPNRGIQEFFLEGNLPPYRSAIAQPEAGKPSQDSILNSLF